MRPRRERANRAGGRGSNELSISSRDPNGRPNMDGNVTYVGMDLGTFKTSVASSASVRDVIYSAVGWPKDQVARTMLGRDVVFGQDIHHHRLALNIVRPFEKGVLKFNSHKDAGLAAE